MTRGAVLGVAGSRLRPELSALLEETVLSICQKQYCQVAGVEVDAIICISLLDTAEQQVVKVHKTLYHAKPWSVKDTVEPSSGDGSPCETSVPVTMSGMVTTNPTAATKRQSVADSDKGSASRKRRRKQATVKHMEDAVSRRSHFGESALEMTVDSIVEEPRTDRESPPADVEHNFTVIKTEPEDPGYNSALQPSAVHQMQHVQPPGLIGSEGQQVGSHDNSTQQPMEAQNLNTGAENDQQTVEPCEKAGSSEDQSDFTVRIKAEKDDDSEYQSAIEQPVPMVHEASASPAGSQNDSNGAWGESAGKTSNAESELFGLGGSIQPPLHHMEEPIVSKQNILPSKRSKTQKVDNWFDMVRSNVNRYHAALVTKMAKKGKEVPKSLPSKEALKATLAGMQDTVEPYVEMEYVDGQDPGDSGSASQGEESEGQSRDVGEIKVEQSWSCQSRSQSASPKPSDDLKEATRNGEPARKVPVPGQPGKLESRYPALFSQLQKAKEVQVAGAADQQGQQESLVNRLPFISFQELFSQANPTSVVKSEGQVPTQEGAERPRSPQGLMQATKVHVKPRERERGAMQKPVKLKEPVEEDTEWHPSNSDSPIPPFTAPQHRISTRLSSGKKSRQNFAELDDADEDVEEEEEEEEEEERDFKFVSSACRNNCGAKFLSLGELQRHEVSCKKTEFTCSICGLQFNQEYRWQYHMTKVHKMPNVTAVFH